MDLPETQDQADVAALAIRGEALFQARDFAQAYLTWQEFLRRVPYRIDGYLRGGAAAREAARYDEAEALFSAAVARFPGDSRPLCDLALLADYQRDWSVCLERWQAVRRQFPDLLQGFRGYAGALRDAGRHAEADIVHLQGMREFPADIWLAYGYAMTAQHQRRWDESLRRWQFLRERFPHEISGHTGAAFALQELDRFDEARAALRDATALAPDDLAVQRAVASLELKVRDFRAATARVAAMRAAFPAAAVDVGPDVVGVLISCDPVIILSAVYSLESVVVPTMAYYRAMSRRPHYFFNSNMSLLFEHDLRARFEREAKTLRECYPDARITFLANEVAEVDVARAIGLDADLVSNNAFVDERVFVADPAAVKRFDAVYNARFAPYKRHHLATAIGSLTLIAADPTPDQLAQLAALLPRAALTSAHVNSAKVTRIVNEARSGLCLSSAEGAMYAAMEYLLCGVPVVTTRAIGGRGWWLTDDIAITADDTAEDVAACVGRMVARGVAPAFVRDTALQRLRRERAVFFELVERIFVANGQPARRYAPEFARDFHDKWNYKARPLSALLAPC